MICIENMREKIFVFGRNSDMTPYRKCIDYKPYFYVEDEEGKHVSIDGKKLRKIEVATPDLVVKEREGLKHFEGDVIYINRYLVDCVDILDKEFIRICFLDLETETVKELLSFKNKIISISVHDNILEKYTALVVGRRENIITKNKDVLFFNTEEDLLKKFAEFINLTDPDVLCAWNGDGFDFPYIIKRFEANKLNANKLSRMNCSFTDKDRTIIKGRVLFDLMQGYKKISQNQRESYALDFISKLELNEGKKKYSGSLQELYEKDLDGFIEYNIKDVELMVMLNSKLNIIEYFDEIRRLAFCTLNDVFQNSRVVDQLVLKEAKRLNVVLPSKSNNHDERIEGAFVMKSTAGVFKEVAVCDMKSLYPSLMITFNLGYETLLNQKEEGCINIDNTYYYSKSRSSLIKDIITSLLRERKRLRDEMKRVNHSSLEYKSLDLRQYAVKVIANSIYGVMGYSNFRLFNRTVAETVTYLGRKVIKYVIEFMKSKGMETLYGDTDSIFLIMNEKSKEDIAKCVDELNLSFNEFIKQFNLDKHILELQFEKVYKSVLFSGVKKRYAGIVSWRDGKEVNEIDIKGFEERRSDTPQMIRDFQKQLFKIVLEGNTKEEIEKFINDTKERIKTVEPEMIALPIGVSAPLNKYKNLPVHIRAVQNANKYHGAKIRMGDKIKWLYVLRGSGKCPDNVIAFKDKLWEGYKVDYPKMIVRLINHKLEVIEEATKNKYIEGSLINQKPQKEVMAWFQSSKSECLTEF